jgi:hypothetical protein
VNVINILLESNVAFLSEILLQSDNQGLLQLLLSLLR